MRKLAMVMFLVLVTMDCRRMLRAREGELSSPDPVGRTAARTGTLGAGDHDLSVDMQGTKRSYLVHVPKSYQAGRPMPLIINYHGAGGGPEGHIRLSKMNDAADRHGFIAVYPRGTRSDGEAGARFKNFWNPGSGPTGQVNSSELINRMDDVAFTKTILDTLEADLSVDTKRVFATGLSNGGMMAQRVGCDLSDRIAAIGPVSGPFWQNADSCKLKRPVSVIYFHGTADPCSPPQGGPGRCGVGLSSGERSYPSVQHTLDVWKEKNHCTGEPVTTYQHGEVTCRTWQKCAEGSEVEFCSIEGGGHTWPGGTSFWVPGVDVGKLSHDIDADDAMWEFFSRHPLN